VASEIVADGGRCSFHACDIRQEEAVQDVVQAIVVAHGRIDGLVNNAGGQYITPLESISAKGWDAVVSTNLTGGFLVARECYLQSMQAQGGAIVNIVADIWGSMPGMGHSGAARAGMVSFTETAALEWAKSGVRVNAWRPATSPPAAWTTTRRKPARCCARCASTVPAGPLRHRGETSAGIVFLLSPAAFHQRQRAAHRRRPAAGAHGLGPIAAPDRGAAARCREALRRLSPLPNAEGASVMTCSSPGTRSRHWRSGAREAMLARIAQLRALEAAQAADKSAKARPVFEQARPAAAARARGLLLDAGRPGLPLCALAGYLQDSKDAGPVGAGRRHDRRHRLRQRRALHGGGQRFGHRSRRDPGHGPGQDPARAGDRAAEQAALHAPGGKRRRQPACATGSKASCMAARCSATWRACRPRAFR
jgi:NAD(P)-dependent dehydrogenase (short-subunit alcohol dehydrogenase family)